MKIPIEDCKIVAIVCSIASQEDILLKDEGLCTFGII